MNWFSSSVLVIIVTISVYAVLVSSGYTSEVTAHVGESVTLNFDYRGPTYNRYYFIKNGRYLRADRRRIFERWGRIYFSKVTEYDAGVYRMVVRSSRLQYTNPIKLTSE